MSYTALMVHQELDGANDSRAQIAGELARRFDAKLIGITAGNPYPPIGVTNSFVAGLVAENRAQISKRMLEAEARFRAAVHDSHREIEWRQSEESPTGYVARQARAADLVIAGSTSNYLDPFCTLDTAELIMRAGRPVLVVPPEAEWLAAKHILVAWKDTREARRAVCDALPLLRTAGDVTIVGVAEDGGLPSAQLGVDDVAEWLKRHGVSAAGNAVRSAEKPFDVLQEMACQNAADLIVSGAYGHTRAHEWIFGGVTRDLLARTKLCCLLAH
jgi:nucleotide-binding universal stress UspA family protein